MKPRKNEVQAARRALGGEPGYAAAREALAKEQTLRVRQIRLEAERKLIPADEVHRLLVTLGQSLRSRLLGIERRLRSAHPGLDAKVYAFLRDAHEDALGLLSADVLKMSEE